MNSLKSMVTASLIGAAAYVLTGCAHPAPEVYKRLRNQFPTNEVAHTVFNVKDRKGNPHTYQVRIMKTRDLFNGPPFTNQDELIIESISPRKGMVIYNDVKGDGSLEGMSLALNPRVEKRADGSKQIDYYPQAVPIMPLGEAYYKIESWNILRLMKLREEREKRKNKN